MSVERLEYNTLLGTLNNNPLKREDYYERGEARTLNKRLKRPLLCH
jgi:hypothetical protein